MVEQLRIATRGSRLALWQAEYVRAALRERYPELAISLVEVVSTGDAVRDRPLHQLGGIGVFTKEVQEAVLDGRADLAVHSLKDLPTQSHPELCLTAIPKRADVADALISPRHLVMESLPRGATVATSSLRRRAMLLRHRPDLQVVDVRGNVETRLRKLHEQSLDGLLLAAAGLQRLGLGAEITQRLEAPAFLPAVGQGALGIECRHDDDATRALLTPLDHPATRQAVEAERAFLHRLQGGCQLPVGAWGTLDDELLQLQGIVLARAGTPFFTATITGPSADAALLGATLAERLLHQGAGDVLE